MLNVLVDHAIDNVWCTPEQDNQVILKLARLTPVGGVFNRYKLHWDYIPLPEKNINYHVFQIGQIHPLLLNLLEKREEWVSLAQACNGKNTILDIYTKEGIQIPRVATYYIVTKTNNILIAIKKNNKIKFDFDKDDIYLRTYYNAYFASTRSQALSDYTYIDGAYISSTSKILEVQNKVVSKQSLYGSVNCFVNGYRQDKIDLTNTSIGDIVEFVYDSSVKKTIDFKLSTLPVFDSLLDKKGKYLLHYAEKTNIIDYQDDIDLYLIDKSTGKGVYVHKNNKDTFRNITHKDYSVVVSYIQDYFKHFLNENNSLNIENLFLRLYVRKSGYDRPLILEQNRINELYKLPDDKIVQAMVGVNSVVPIWKAQNLENSLYAKLMASNFRDINRDFVVSTYGYEAISKLVADTPARIRIEGNNRLANVPLLLQNNSTVYEYDISGSLINWYPHTSGQTYVCKNINTEFVEIIFGQGTNSLDEFFGGNNIPINPDLTYRFYICDIVDNVPTYEWQDITGTNLYSVTNNIVKWNTTNKYTLVRSNGKFICYKQTMNFKEGVLELPIIYLQNRSNTVDDLEISVPLGQLDIFLNGKSLIYNLDYYYDNPRLVIVNKSYLLPNVDQEIVIRFNGFCTDKFEVNKNEEFGFIQLGNLSDNHVYNIKDGKVQRVTVKGSLRTPNSVNYFEDNGLGAITNIDNGKPYSIKDLIIPIKSLTGLDDIDFKNMSLVTEKQVSNYMTLYINQNTPPTLNVTATKHYLYSPFLSRILNELIDNGINTIPLQDRYTDDFVRSICKPYEYLLEYDPISIKNQQSKDYVVVHSHCYNNVVVLDFSRFKFFTRVNELYGNNNVELVNQIRLI